MKKFVKWMLTCNYNRVEALQNFGFAFSMAWLVIGFFSQFLKPLLPLRISIVCLSIGLVLWLAGMIWNEVRERYEELWQND